MRARAVCRASLSHASVVSACCCARSYAVPGHMLCQAICCARSYAVPGHMLYYVLAPMKAVMNANHLSYSISVYISRGVTYGWGC